MMKTRVSAWMDGELDDHEAGDVMRAVERDVGLRQEWDQFHLIGDALRDGTRLDTDLVSRVMDRLENEPTVLAPSSRRKSDRPHPILALAATVAGVAVVGWVALGHSGHSGLSPQPVLVASAPSAVQVSVPAEKIQDYLLAHHAHAPTAAVTSGARYVRTVSMERSQP